MRRPELVAACDRCAALCCVAYPFDASEDFAITKAAHTRCPNLRGHQCGVHEDLVQIGFRGCALYDCYGAGPRITAIDPAALDAFTRLVRVHELAFVLKDDPLVDELLALDPLAEIDLRPYVVRARAVLRK